MPYINKRARTAAMKENVRALVRVVESGKVRRWADGARLLGVGTTTLGKWMVEARRWGVRIQTNGRGGAPIPRAQPWSVTSRGRIDK